MTERRQRIIERIRRREVYFDLTKGKSMSTAQLESFSATAKAIHATLVWLKKHEARIKRYLAHAREIDALLAMQAEDRAAILAYGPLVAELAMEVGRKEADAKAGGPAR
ncbi:hypothetical protein HDIA_2251 [Hartmannibacter diazotrophicus]|uniref:Uncharacterized protein n=1 Tax=Hartmannibacter diazotrophicus TaxID=1482074 RepID=A0A2C9D634_9HYPH|nr:hypothetical protein [Hartmannibacter diazotrophicus]SON55792.1 hypothetical protein HDIA_2251 [Hartmannibacter diazotrophicus]